MEILIVLVVPAYYLLMVLAFALRKMTAFVVLLTVLIVFYDYVFNQLQAYVHPAMFFAIKSWQELLFAGLVIFYVPIVLYRRDWNVSVYSFNILFYVLLLTGLGVAVGLTNPESSVFKIFLGWRNYIFPVLVPFIVYRLGFFEKVKVNTVVFTLYLITIFTVLYAFKQRVDFRLAGGGDVVFLGENFYEKGSEALSVFWFFGTEKFPPSFLLSRWFNMVRGGDARATSIFVSALIYGNFLTLVFYVAFSRFVTEYKGIFKSLFSTNAFMLLVVFMGIYFSQYRTALIQVALGGATILLFYRYRLKFSYLYAIPVLAVAVIIIRLSMGNVDESAAGRLEQYKQMFQTFVVFGKGFGSPETMIKYDSWVISVVMLFGVFVVFYLLLNLRVVKKLYATHIKGGTYFSLAILLFTVNFLVTLAFQYSTGSAPFLLMHYFIFIAIGTAEYELTKEATQTEIYKAPDSEEIVVG